MDVHVSRMPCMASAYVLRIVCIGSRVKHACSVFEHAHMHTDLLGVGGMLVPPRRRSSHSVKSGAMASGSGAALRILARAHAATP